MRPPASCPPVINIAASEDRGWGRFAINILQGDDRRSSDTHLVNPVFCGLESISVYLKHEPTEPTGSLKHRLARSLFLYGIWNCKIRRATSLVKASSGSMAVSEAYFAHLLGLPFIAVMPRSTSEQKIAAIERSGGHCHFVEHTGAVYDTAARIADETSGYYLDQFTYAESATDWWGDYNIAESIFEQMKEEDHPEPTWVVMSADTGGTSATIGRYIRYRNFATRLCVVEVEDYVFHDAWRSGDTAIICAKPYRIEGIGRPRVEPSFIPGVVDHMIRVRDAASIAAMHVLSERLFRQFGRSTGTNFFGVFWLASCMMKEGKSGSIASLICDNGDRYTSTYYEPERLKRSDIDIEPYRKMLTRFLETGQWSEIN